MHTTLKNVELLEHFKISETAPWSLYHIIYTSIQIVIITDNLIVTECILSSSYKHQVTHM